MFVCPTCGLSTAAPGFCTEDGNALADASGDPLLGRTLGSYRLARRIGEGGMGSVYLGVHPGIGSRVAVKVLSSAASESRDLVDRFFAEARAVNVIRHESIVNVLDLAMLPDGRPYIVMEFLEGAPLSAHFSAPGPFPLGVLARLGLEVLAALEAAHSLGITHRDLKPDNVFVTSLGRAKVLDFGIAKLRREQGGEHDGTRTGALLGTPQYMSPEQALGQPVDPRSDVYALGVILYEGATGKRPFESDSLFQLLRMHVEQPPEPPRMLRPDLPPSFEALILRSLAKEREHRFQSARELGEALRPVLLELPDVELGSLPPTPRQSYPAIGPTVQATAHPSTHPSAVGVSSTVAAPGGSSRGSIGLVIGAIGVLVAFAALAVAGVALFVSSDALLGKERSVGSTSGATGQPTPDVGTAAQGSSDRFDAVAALKVIRAEARKKASDAQLVSISISGVNPDGTVSFDAQTHAVAYLFRSPSNSGAGQSCLVSVSKSQYGTFTSLVADASGKCTEPITEAPKCNLQQVMKEAPVGKKVTSVTFINQQGAWFWALILDGGGVLTKPDAC